jgi:(2Fe-2S) ferredoxin
MKEFFQYAVPAMMPVVLLCVRIWYMRKQKKTADEVVDLVLKEAPAVVEKVIDVYTKQKVKINAIKNDGQRPKEAVNKESN